MNALIFFLKLLFVLVVFQLKGFSTDKNLEKGFIVKVSSKLTVLPEENPANFPPRLRGYKYIPQGGTFEVLSIRYPENKTHLAPYYFCSTRDYEGGFICTGWIDSGSLIGKEIKIIKSESTKPSANKSFVQLPKVNLMERGDLKNVFNFAPTINFKGNLLDLIEHHKNSVQLIYRNRSAREARPNITITYFNAYGVELLEIEDSWIFDTIKSGMLSSESKSFSPSTYWKSDFLNSKLLFQEDFDYPKYLVIKENVKYL